MRDANRLSIRADADRLCGRHKTWQVGHLVDAENRSRSRAKPWASLVLIDLGHDRTFLRTLDGCLTRSSEAESREPAHCVSRETGPDSS